MLAITNTTILTRNDLEGHRIRILAAEKGHLATSHIVTELPPELHHLNPSHTLPVLLDKGLILYGSTLIDNYLDERFPAPLLLPQTPTARAKVRFLAEQIRNWYPLAEQADVTSLTTLAYHLGELEQALDHRNSWFVGELYTLIDIAAAPLLNILPQLGLDPPANSATRYYLDRIRKRPAWDLSEPPCAIRTPLDVCFESRTLH